MFWSVLDFKGFITAKGAIPVKSYQRSTSFTYKIAPIWNRPPAEAVNSASVEQFKIELDKVIDTLIWYFFSF